MSAVVWPRVILVFTGLVSAGYVGNPLAAGFLDGPSGRRLVHLSSSCPSDDRVAPVTGTTRR
jgi:hypothetical protein